MKNIRRISGLILLTAMIVILCSQVAIAQDPTVDEFISELSKWTAHIGYSGIKEDSFMTHNLSEEYDTLTFEYEIPSEPHMDHPLFVLKYNSDTREILSISCSMVSDEPTWPMYVLAPCICAFYRDVDLNDATTIFDQAIKRTSDPRITEFPGTKLTLSFIVLAPDYLILIE